MICDETVLIQGVLEQKTSEGGGGGRGRMVYGVFFSYRGG